MVSLHRLLIVILVAMGLMLASCGGGSGTISLDPATPDVTDPVDPNDDPTRPDPIDEPDVPSVVVTMPVFRVLDLESGLVTNKTGDFDPLTASAESVVFALVDPDDDPDAEDYNGRGFGTVSMGTAPGELGYTPDEVDRLFKPFDPYYIAVTELTQYQWTLLSRDGSTPWADAVPRSIVGSSLYDPLRPVFGVSYDELLVALGTYQTVVADYELRVPKTYEWEYACRAGTESAWYFGETGGDLHQDVDVSDFLVAAEYCVVRETNEANRGVRAVGGREPNALDLYDMHGNLWEFIDENPDTPNSEVFIRGGSWNDNILHARSANMHSISSDAPWALVGIRLAMPVDAPALLPEEEDDA